MGVHVTIELTLLQFPKIILMFAAVFFFFSMIDSFGDLKALLPINHRQVEGGGDAREHGGSHTEGGAAQR